jgi:hypothetical protein
MRSTTALLLLSAALCWVTPASADVSGGRQTRLAGNVPTAEPLEMNSREMSSRHRHGHRGRIVAVGRACTGFTVAPTLEKTYFDRRWPYVSWRGSCDSLYAPGPLVTFVRYGY